MNAGNIQINSAFNWKNCKNLTQFYSLLLDTCVAVIYAKILYHKSAARVKINVKPREKGEAGLFLVKEIIMEELKTSFDGKTGNGSVTLYANPFGTGKKYYGKFAKDTVSAENLVARIQEKNPGADEIIINTSISYLKREILTALKEGKAVNVLDLGIIYIAAVGSAEDDSATGMKDLELSVKFTPSQLLKDNVAKVQISNIVYSNTSPVINRITNWFTGEVSTSLTQGKNVVLEGKRLKLGEVNSGLYLAPVDSNTVPVDESRWIDCTSLVRLNTPKKIDFYLPAEAQTGESYRIVVKSDFLKTGQSRKEPVYTYSDIVTVSAA